MEIPPRQSQPDAAAVARYARFGMTAEQIAIVLRLDPGVLEDERFHEAVEYWRMVGLSEVAEQCRRLAVEGNLRAITFLLKAVGGWSESSRGTKEEGPRWDRFLLEEAPDFVEP